MSTFGECSGHSFGRLEVQECSGGALPSAHLSIPIEKPSHPAWERGFVQFNGEGGIRTPDDPKAILDFESSAFNRSATSPGGEISIGRKWTKSSPQNHQPSTYPKISGATMVASDSTMKLGVSTAIFSQVIFSLGTAPEYEP